MNNPSSGQWAIPAAGISAISVLQSDPDCKSTHSHPARWLGQPSPPRAAIAAIAPHGDPATSQGQETGA